MTQTVKFNNLTVTIDKRPDQVIYTFDGDVDESFAQERIEVSIGPRAVLLLEKIRNFNSVGIREWIYLIRRMHAFKALEFHRCSVTMVDQINMIPDSLGHGTIKSFFAPYYCSAHGESSQLIDVSSNQEPLLSARAPEFRCESCGNRLDFDALEESYFMFFEEMKTAS